MTGCVLVVDDNDQLRGAIRECLELDGYTVFGASSGDEAMKILRVKKADAILLDLVLPDGDGLALLSGIKQLSDATVIVISGKGGWVDKVVGLEMGADDYLGKPFEMKELTARVKAGIRRAKNGKAQPKDEPPRKLRFAGLTLDSGRCQAFDGNGKSCDLTAMEFRLLEALAAASGRVLTREQLLDKARANNLNVGDRAIDIQIARIRKKIGDGPKEPEIIRTARGVGYTLDCKVEVEE
jgi:DNA-binding response OmpR family regulator